MSKTTKAAKAKKQDRATRSFFQTLKAELEKIGIDTEISTFEDDPTDIALCAHLPGISPGTRYTVEFNFDKKTLVGVHLSYDEMEVNWTNDKILA